MIIKNMFSKPIDRDIKGVIKVGQDDDANIKQELEEYVVTRELQKHFSDFFASYKKGITGNTDKMGVWISGFFGSGKSHFLKILSYLLENKEVGGKKAIDYFVDDNKISDQMVLADMKLAGTIPTDVVLFNIDSKSEVNGKQSKVAIVSVLQNVFNEMQGFSGSNPFLADLERNLTEEGKYDLFKEKFEDGFGSAWEESRSDFDFIQDDVVEVLDEIGFMSVEAGRNFCEKATGEYTYKVEDFTRLVKKYLDKKENNHHIVFLIDEIGQYIGDDSKLMLNLQTVTEDLGTACGGKAWIIVTSQQDIDSITKTKGNDFSKIQGRFDTRLSLSSANVDEVIKKRILEKNEAGKQTLTLLYDDKATVIKNLILFNDGVEKKLYSDRENFADIRDLYDNSIVAYKTDKEQSIKLVLDTIKAAKRKEKITAEVQLHSDQGFQYTSHAYFNLTQSYGITPSMSRRGNPYDNALAENFFSILKTECIHRVKLSGYDEARLIISEYINFYNNYRIQTKTKLTPLEKRNQFVA